MYINRLGAEVEALRDSLGRLGVLILLAMFATWLSPWSVRASHWVAWLKLSLTRCLRRGQSYFTRTHGGTQWASSLRLATGFGLR